jgi:hypothetical protein
MGDTVPQDSTACYAVIDHSSAPGVLLLAVEGGLSLPHIEAADLGPWFDVAGVNRAFGALLGLRMTVLRCLEGDVNTSEARVRVYAMEGHDPAWTPPAGSQWLTRAALDDARLATPEHRAVIASWLDETAGIGRQRTHAPWTRRGWHARAERFVSAELASRGIQSTAPIEQLRTWQRSCVLRASTTSGNFIFKASPAMFGAEPSVTRFLASQYPKSFPEVLSIDAREPWTLMREVTGRLLRDTDDLECWAGALRAFACIQVDCAARVGQLAGCGCPAWPLERFIERTAPFIDDAGSMLIGTAHGLTTDEAGQLRALGPALRETTEELFRHNLPLTLEHGDFRSVHAVVTDDGYAFFDLSDSAVTHPFFSAVALLDFEKIPPLGAPADAVRTYLRDAYLDVWSSYAPKARLIAAFELARVVAILYAALYRYDAILPHIEPKERWEFMIPYWQRMLLGALRDRRGGAS